ncbi:resolvase [Lysinibacillus sphaericus]|uniref:recombinase family protein n=1 Tax=Lysinibacillus sphaericus TaxID=1421 RepID=UPI0018CD572E|nr:recombinase family protein [Lysinibacillus sphaericus]MBG9456032.1 resolvase [Lysinibacillus sphaericus]MBG9479319.1 resolvase [Lysinibacillus sphaericus]MBG9593426.1 resolvase [Lysinibacillus sphaericus]
MGLNFCYMRVSTTAQNQDRQEDILMKFVSLDESGKPYLYCDKASGKDMQRKGFQEMFRAMRPGDTLYVKSIDRIGRNKHQIKQYLEKLRNKQIRIKIIDIPTTMHDFPPEQDWVADMVNNILIEVYTSIAEQERNTILQRQREGIEAAKAKGRHLGRPIIEYPPDWSHLYKLWVKGVITSKEFMIKVEMKKSTFYTKVKKYREQQKTS